MTCKLSRNEQFVKFFQSLSQTFTEIRELRKKDWIELLVIIKCLAY